MPLQLSRARGNVDGMASRRISANEWRRLSEAEQRSMIRESMADFGDLPDDIRVEVEEMLANARPIPSSA